MSRYKNILFYVLTLAAFAFIIFLLVRQGEKIDSGWAPVEVRRNSRPTQEDDSFELRGNFDILS